MKRSRVIGLLAASVVAAGGLSACSASSNSNSDGVVNISITEYQQTRIDAVNKLIPGFEAEMKKQGKNIKVTMVADVLTDDQFKTKITQQLIAGQAPDVLDLGDSVVPGFAGAGYLAPLDDYLNNWDGWSHYYPQIKTASARQDGHVYDLVHETGVQNLFYRKDVLTSLGISTTQPATWDDLLARMVEVKNKTGGTPIVIPAGTAWGGSTWTEGFQPILGGTDKNYYSLDTGKWDLNSSGFHAVFDLYSQLFSKGLLPVQDLQNPNPWEPTKYVGFPAGTIPVAAQGTSGWKFDWGPAGKAPIPDLNNVVDTWQYPGLRSGDTPYGWSGLGFGFGIPEKSQHKDEAMLLAEYLSAGEPLADQLVSSGAASPRDDLADVKPYADEPKLIAAGKNLASSVYVPTGDGADQIAQAVAAATELIISGTADGDQAYDAFKKDATDLLGPSLIK
ncbi:MULTISPECIES: ABC transporter substrate-binding protein [Subtercola]|uniref:Extracellular solute-binding protein n=1 Tax=Subtercola vilae TaxID=2056433 RepID=A0A4T2C896_9MICO|nr:MULTISPECIES: extracellular solute-binding protein [Subtercola]MEA9986418.1 extracellular solute-binding protein [Subtercola sp. RTI3]TIH40400.1 extracellular solute-binding protein [Subtercola vilae]